MYAVEAVPSTMHGSFSVLPAKVEGSFVLCRTPWRGESLSEDIGPKFGIYAAWGFTIVFLAVLAKHGLNLKILEGATRPSRLQRLEYGFNESIMGTVITSWREKRRL